MNIIPDYLIEMALANNTTYSRPKQYTIANSNSDSCLDSLKNQPGVSNFNFPFSDKRDDYSIDVEKDDLDNIFELELNDTSILDDNELNLILNANDQIHYIFITDDLGKIWYEKEIDPFQQFLKIDINQFLTGSYNILIENDGSFFTKRFVKTK